MIRKFELSDMTSCIDIASRFHEESSYSVLKFNRGKVLKLLELTTKDDSFFCMVADGETGLIGVMLGKIFQHIFTEDLMAVDLVTYVIPERRGGITGTRFIKLFESWASDKGAIYIDLGVTSDIINDKVQRLYEAMGFKQIGFCFRKVM